MSKAVYLTDNLKTLLSSSLLGLTFEKAGNSTPKGKIKTFIVEERFLAMLKLPISVLEAKKARMMV